MNKNKIPEEHSQETLSNTSISLTSPRFIPFEIFIIFLSGFLLNIRFESVLLNRIVALFLSAFPLYAFIRTFRGKFTNPYAKITCLSLTGFLALASLVFLTPNMFYLAAVIKDGGVDSSFEIVNATSQGSSQLVTYRTNGGATTGFGTVQRLEQSLLPCIYLIRHIYIDLGNQSNN